MGTLINRGLSLLIYLGYLAAAYFNGAGLNTVKITVFLLSPMGCIWFSEAFGGYTGLGANLQVIDIPTPAFLICACGWLLLVGVPVLLYFIVGCTS
jgi:hypothetical protein